MGSASFLTPDISYKSQMDFMNNDFIATHEKPLSRPLFTTAFEDNSAASDRSERLEVINRLTHLTADLADTEQLQLATVRISLESDSSLHQALQPGVANLKMLAQKAEFKTMLGKLMLSDYTDIQVTDDGRLSVRMSGNWIDLTNALKRDPGMNEDLDVLTELAVVTGGAVTSGEQVRLLQWLSFHRFHVPGNVEEGKRLIGFLMLPFSAGPAPSHYWELLSGDEDSPVVLSPTQRNQIRAQTHGYLRGERLLQHLAKIVFGGRTQAFQHSEAHDALARLAASPIGRRWAQTFITDLDWYGANGEAPQFAADLAQALLTAILLDLHPSIGEPAPRNHVLGFNLYAAEYVEQSPAFVHSQFEQHLVEQHGFDAQYVALAAHLLLAETAPAFLIRNLPSGLRLGTPQWIDHCRAVTVMELNAPGSSCVTTYAQLQHLKQFDAVSEPQQTLNALAAVDPMIDWALLHGIATMQDVTASIPHALEKALTAHAQYNQYRNDTAQALSRPLPTRKDVALDLLQFAAPECDYLADDLLVQKRNRSEQDMFADPLHMSLLDLHMSNDLATGDWDLKTGGSVYAQFPDMLPRLAPPDGVFRILFKRAYVTYAASMTAHLKQTLSSLPLLDRTRLLEGEVTCFTLRPSAATLMPADPISLVVDFPEDLSDLIFQENQKGKDAATGRYGVALCTRFEERLYCYEMFTLHGECRENPHLAKLILEKDLLNQPARADFTGSMSRYVRPAPLYQLPTDLECYTHGVPPGLAATSEGVIEKLAVLAANTDFPQHKRGYYQSLHSGELDRLANFVLKHRPIATFDELSNDCWGQTALEKRRADREEELDTFLNIIVPFKSCIEDINSDDPQRQHDGLRMCVLDGAMTLLLVVGVVAQIAVIAAKSATITVKAVQMAKAGAMLLNSLFNPLDGVPDLLRGGVRLIHQGILRGGKVNLLTTAVTDLRTLTGTAPKNAWLSAADPDVIRLGQWRQAGQSADLFNVWGIRHNGHWYALNRQGKPWGAKLDDFEPAKVWRLFKLDKIMPASYTRKLLKDALPISRTKLDDAIKVVADESLKNDSGWVLKLLMGDHSPQGKSKFLRHLQDVKKDLSHVSPDNFLMDTKRGDTIASLNTRAYREWTNLPATEAARKKFIRIYTKTFNNQFRVEGYSHGVLADDILHELFHGAPHTLDHAYASLPRSGRMGEYQRLDVRNLLNLASGHIKDPATLKKFEPFDNAESFMMATTLLSQQTRDPVMFRRNIEAMRIALQKASSQTIDWEVLVHLNPV
jgi:hypothetical protein